MRVHFHRASVTVAGPIVCGIISHNPTFRNANNSHDRVDDPANDRITGVWALTEDDLQGPHRQSPRVSSDLLAAALVDVGSAASPRTLPTPYPPSEWR